MMLPTMLKLDGPVIIFGAGSVALRKVEYVLKFTQDVQVIAEEFQSLPEHVRTTKAKVVEPDIGSYIPEGTALVIAALSDSTLNRAIARHCRDRRILVNAVDDPEPSTVIFPALSKEGDLSISISTSGRCPFLARKLREELDALVEDRAGWLEVLAPVREKLVGMEEKNRVLSLIYNDAEVKRLIMNNDLEGAKRKAWEVYDVHSQH